jgi:hypothetical protein
MAIRLRLGEPPTVSVVLVFRMSKDPQSANCGLQTRKS